MIARWAGPATVKAPLTLAQAILNELKTAVDHYGAGVEFDGFGVSSALMDLSAQSRLPF